MRWAKVGDVDWLGADVRAMVGSHGGEGGSVGASEADVVRQASEWPWRSLHEPTSSEVVIKLL